MKTALLILIAAAVLLAGCAPGDARFGGTAEGGGSPAGFWWGIWHGWIAPFSLVVGFFRPAVRLYEVNNSGWWYDLGFYMAILGGFGGIAFSRKKKDHD